MSKNRLVLPPNSNSSSRTAQRELTTASDIALSICFAVLVALSFALTASGTSIIGADGSGVLFLMVALFYRGSNRTWWGFYAPIGLILLFAPVARWESIGVINPSGIMRASLIPGLAFIAACLVATVRESLQLSIEGSEELRTLRARGLMRVREVQSMGNDMKTVVELISNSKSLPPAPLTPAGIENPLIETSWDTVEFTSNDAMSAYIESETLSYSEVQRLLNTELEKAAKNLVNKNVKLHLTSPNDVTIPLAVRGNSEAFCSFVQALIERAMESLIGPNGVVRVTLKPGLRSVSLLIEDNGRGLNEALILKLEAKGFMKHSDNHLSWRELRSLAESSGWNLDIQARLGVGSRVTLDLPRVDAFVYGARVSYARELKTPLNSSEITSGLDSSSQPG